LNNLFSGGGDVGKTGKGVLNRIKAARFLSSRSHVIGLSKARNNEGYLWIQLNCLF
jgi:hypothetical protein